MRREISVTTAGPQRSAAGMLIASSSPAAFALTSAPADASYIHPEPGYEFGPTGLSTSSFPGNVAEMDFDQSSKRIFLLNKNETKIYSLDFEGPGTLCGKRIALPALSRRIGLLH